MAASRAHSETGTVVNTKFGARPIIDLPAFAFSSNRNVNSNIADAQPRMLGPSEYSYNAGRNVPRDHSNGGYIGQYYRVPSQSGQPVYQNPNSNFVKESNVIPYPSYTTIPNMAPQQPPPQSVPPVQPVTSIQNGQAPSNDGYQQGSPGKEIHHYYGPNGERLPGPPATYMLPRQTANLNLPPISFKIDATLEYGKMVSIRIREGNVSFRDIPDFVISDCKKTYRVIPKTDVTIVADQGEYRVYATPDLNSQPLDRLMENIYDPYIRGNYRRRAVQYPQSYSPPRRKVEADFYTKKYDGENYVDNSLGRRHVSHTVQSDRPRVEQPKRSPQRHWYSSDQNRVHYTEEYEYDKKPRDPQRIPLPMRPMHLKREV